MRALIKSNAKAWDLLLPHTELAYNNAPNKTTEMSSFKVIYGIDPSSPLDLVPKAMNEKPSVVTSKRIKEIRKLHELVTVRLRNLMPPIKLKLTSIRRE